MKVLKIVALLFLTLLGYNSVLAQTDPEGQLDYFYIVCGEHGYPGAGQTKVCFQLRFRTDNTAGNRVNHGGPDLLFTGNNIVSVDTSLVSAFIGSALQHWNILLVQKFGNPDPSTPPFHVHYGGVNFTMGLSPGDYLWANICLTIDDTGTIVIDTLSDILLPNLVVTEFAQSFTPGWGGTAGNGYPQGQGVSCGIPFCNAKPGDANASGTLTVADILALFYYINGKPNHPPCGSNSVLCWLSDELCRGDWNGDGLVRFVDIQYGVNYIFNKPGGPWTPKPTKLCCQPVP